MAEFLTVNQAVEGSSPSLAAWVVAQEEHRVLRARHHVGKQSRRPLCIRSSVAEHLVRGQGFESSRMHGVLKSSPGYDGSSRDIPAGWTRKGN